MLGYGALRIQRFWGAIAQQLNDLGVGGGLAEQGLDVRLFLSEAIA